ncbi:hypothetical protein BDZ89DRAFT_1150154 [Hymenopellis radicata]|nr:hypothetical protein BDZ89DRAFT_1150154 [Hymenopellis radicata]
MGQFWNNMPPHIMEFIRKQHMFWVATAPLSADGHINLSSKGLEGTFHVIDNKTVWYEDMTGSGVETISHVRENGRITVLFNAFEGPPNIVRLFGKGTIYEFGTSEYNSFISASTRRPGSRAVIMIHVHKVGSSCGYSVPMYTYVGQRTKLDQYAARCEHIDLRVESQSEYPEGGLRHYWNGHNAKGIDGLPGLRDALTTKDRFVGGARLDVQKSNSPDGKMDTVRSFIALNIGYVIAFILGVVLTSSLGMLRGQLGLLLPTQV